MNGHRRASSRAAAIVALIATASILAWTDPSPQDAAAPDKPALAHLRAYIDAFNASPRGEMRSFFATHLADAAIKEVPVTRRLVRFRSAKAQLQSLELVRVVSDMDDEASALAKAGNGQFLLLRATSEKAPPHKLVSLTIDLVDDPDNIVAPDPKPDVKTFATAVGEFLQTRAKADEFSGVVLVAREGRVLFHEAYGLADRDKKVPNRKDTKFNLGSINKNFTRAAVLQLVRQGKIALDDKIMKFLPDYPNAEAAEKVSVQQLLAMTSGIGDFFGDRYDATPKEKILSLQDYLPLFANRPLEFEPGTSNTYSNGGYIVLGLIIEKASGTDYYTYVRENIFKPCGMTDTDAYPRDGDTPNLAHGYTRESPGGPWVLNFATLPGRGSSAGGGYSTAADLLKYVAALETGKIFLPDVANGLGIAGGAPGINSVLEWDPRSGYTVIVLTNFDPPTAGQASRQIVSWLPR
jgi:D-alanyl-D-alanine carboxypeptidase